MPERTIYSQSHLARVTVHQEADSQYMGQVFAHRKTEPEADSFEVGPFAAEDDAWEAAEELAFSRLEELDE